MTTPLQRIRIARGLTQKQVALGAEIDPGQYSRIENAKEQATPRAAERIAKSFGHEVTEMQILYPERYEVPEEPEQKAS